MFSKLFLSRCDYFFARGEKTLAFLTDLELDTKKLDFAADIAFCYQQGYCLSTENSSALDQLYEYIDKLVQDGKKIVAISPSILVREKMNSGELNYIQLLIDLIKQVTIQIYHLLYFLMHPEKDQKKREIMISM